MAVVTKKTLGDALDEVAAKYPNNDAIVFKGQHITYREMQQKVNRLAKGLLQLGVRKGDNVAIWMGNKPEWIFTEYAVAKIGAATVTVNTRNRVHETEYILRQSESKVVVVPNRFLNIGFVDMLREIAPELATCPPGQLQSARLPDLKTVICVEPDQQPGTYRFDDVMALGNDVSDEELARVQAACDPDDVVLIVYTSGTTGLPKGAMLTHRSTLDHMAVVADRMEMTPEDKMIFALPLFHVGGSVIAIMTALTTASTICLLEYFDPEEALKVIHKERCQLISGVPTMFIMMLEHPNFDQYDTSCGRTGIIGGSPAPVELIRAIIEKMGVRKICSAYGLTESSSCQTGTLPSDSPELISSTVGVPYPDNEIAILDLETGELMPAGQQGEICVRGAVNMKGYYKKPEETAKTIDQNGWLHTGDLAVQDPNGYYRITGRVKDMFIVGGSNAYPAEVEDFLYAHPKVKQVYVVGVPDHRLGEVGMAFLELKEGETATADEIIEFCKGKLANYKVPRYVKFMKEYPMTASGKVQKFKLRDDAIVELGLKKETAV